MKFDPGQMVRLAQGLVDRYRGTDFISIKGTEEALKLVIGEVLRTNFDEEEHIEREARALMASHGRGGGELDTHKAFLLIKQRLAKQKGFIL